jgi:hypothetical protein
MTCRGVTSTRQLQRLAFTFYGRLDKADPAALLLPDLGCPAGSNNLGGKSSACLARKALV